MINFSSCSVGSLSPPFKTATEIHALSYSILLEGNQQGTVSHINYLQEEGKRKTE